MQDFKDDRSPSFANWLASKLVGEALLEELLGDLQEIYEDRISSKGRFYAKAMYWFDLLHLLIGFSSFRSLKTQNNNPIMIRNMFKIAWRNAIRQKQFTVLNMLGLTIGITTCLIIGLYVHNEVTYDTFHAKGDRIYRINQPNIWDDWGALSSATGPNVATALKEDIPEFEQVTRLMGLGSQTVSYDVNGKEKVSTFKEDRFFAAAENFFDVFSFEFYEGDPKTALKEPLSMIMTNETAIRYFGYVDAVGQTLEVKEWDGSWRTYTVRGVLANIPAKSHLQFDILVSTNSYQDQLDRNGWKWIWTVFSTYGLVHEGTDIATLRDKLQSIPPKWAPPTTEKIFNQTFEEFTAGNPWTLDLQPLKEIYLSENPNVQSFGPSGNPQFIKIFGAIGILVLLLSSINFMNLSTARSAGRAKEVGVRKALGSQRKTLIQQFIFESVLFVASSTAFALLLTQLLIGPFNYMAEKQLALVPLLINPLFIVLIVLFVLLLGIISGSYPAFYLSSFKPIETLKGKMRAGFKGKGLRNGLVVFQFTISIVLIICAFFVQKQLAFTSTIDVGFAKNNILQIHNIEQLGFDTEVLKNQLSSNPAFSKIGKSFGLPPNVWSGDRYRASGPESPVVQLNNLRTEADYLDLLKLEFTAGGNFDPANPNDKYKVILNEEAVKTLGWSGGKNNVDDSPIGKIVALASGTEDEFEVVGVVKDFNFSSLRQNIAPLIIIHHQNDKVWDYGGGLSYLSMRWDPDVIVNSMDLQLLIEDVEETLAALDPSIPFEYSFMNQEFENTFKYESSMSVILNMFTIMALIIACLGLFGLAAFSAEQRIKELGIRKVLGAKASELVVLFSSEFTKLILISILLSLPIAYFLVNEWLSDFAYRTPINIWVFIMAICGALFIAISTISYQSFSAALKNPVETLRDE